LNFKQELEDNMSVGCKSCIQTLKNTENCSGF